ncbi:DNA (cytosine-5)-methyltransferase 1B isoform X10 [Rhizophagus irregularis DAOM 181602=DAOM 197198]|nr:DNA (cytosine-5)-methyltransferase 1B isoform X10 [Rhizophagus irregularis DAOM 181602=DAOM 197198]CAG8695566.1 12858_t:CDS:2 [Rhizophagus irregularis]
MGYQTRFSVQQAGHHGVPQSRRRLFIWGAKRGSYLPDFPQPSTWKQGSINVLLPDGTSFTYNHWRKLMILVIRSLTRFSVQPHGRRRLFIWEQNAGKQGSINVLLLDGTSFTYNYWRKLVFETRKMSVLTYYGTSPQFVVNDEIDQGDTRSHAYSSRVKVMWQLTLVFG